MCKSGTTYSLWLDGISQGSVVAATPNTPTGSSASYGVSLLGSNNLWVITPTLPQGAAVDGYRVTRGVARYTSNFPLVYQAWPTRATSGITAAITGVVLLLHFEDGNFATLFQDSSPSEHTMRSLNNTSMISTNQKAFGSSSLYVPSNGDVYTQSGSDWDIVGSSASCTIELWVYFSSVSAPPYYAGKPAYLIRSGSKWAVSVSAGRVVTFTTSIGVGFSVVGGGLVTANGWTHVAAVMNAGVMTLYVGGVGGTPATTSGTTLVESAQLEIGVNGFSGSLDEVRISKDTAIYTANFIPPTAASTNPSPLVPHGTLLLMHFEGSFADSSTYAQTPSVLSDSTQYLPVIDYTVFKVGAASGKFSMPPAAYGYAYVSFPYASNGYATPWNVFGTTMSGTVEFWMYPTLGDTGMQTIVGWGATWYITWSYPGVITLTTANPSYPGGQATISSPTLVGTGVWTHIAIVNNLGSITIYVNGVGSGAWNISPVSISATPDPLVIGTWTVQNTGYLEYMGYLDELRISSTAVYTGNFTPPTTPLS